MQLRAEFASRPTQNQATPLSRGGFHLHLHALKELRDLMRGARPRMQPHGLVPFGGPPFSAGNPKETTLCGGGTPKFDIPESWGSEVVGFDPVLERQKQIAAAFRPAVPGLRGERRRSSRVGCK